MLVTAKKPNKLRQRVRHSHDLVKRDLNALGPRFRRLGLRVVIEFHIAIGKVAAEMIGDFVCQWHRVGTVPSQKIEVKPKVWIEISRCGEYYIVVIPRQKLADADPALPSGPEALTARQMEIAKMIADRKCNKEIAIALNIETRTVKFHIHRIFERLHVKNRSGVIRRVFPLALLALLALTASAQSIDTTTGSAWQGKYGSNGYEIPLGVSSLQSTATVSVTGASTWNWATGFTCWYSASSFTITVTILDGQPHQVAFWAMDYDKQGRTETINGVQLASFQSGAYVVFTVSGNATFTITHGTGGPNAVVDGIFFDPGPTTPAPAVMHEVILSWTGVVASGTTFNVYRNAAKIANVATTTYTDTSVQAGQTYSYTVTTVTSAGESTQAPVTAFTIPSP
jgi:DNA-binding CsgD family transcriptional regulator